MISNSHCTACLRVIRQQLRYSRPGHTTPLPKLYRSTRTFSLSTSLASSAQTAEKPPSPPPSPPTPASRSQETNANTGRNYSFARNTADKVAQKIRKTAPVTTETYIAYGACEDLVKECARQADYTIPQAGRKDRGEIPKSKNGEDLGVGQGWWYNVLGLTPTFNTWAQVTFLHMYLLTVRIRVFSPTQAPIWHQHLLDHFFYAAEERMVIMHGIQARSVRNKYLKDLLTQWRGLLAGYDEGLAKGSDAVLATALWRNIFSADEDVDLTLLGAVVSYTRGVLTALEEMDDTALVTGEVAFGDPASQLDEVLALSRTLMTTPAVEGKTRPGRSQLDAEGSADEDEDVPTRSQTPMTTAVEGEPQSGRGPIDADGEGEEVKQSQFERLKEKI